MDIIMEKHHNLDSFLQKISEEVEPVALRGRLAWWNLATTGNEEYEKIVKDSQVALRKIYSSPEGYRFLTLHHISSDPLITRQHLLMLNQFKENQIPLSLIEEMVERETTIESRYTNFRPIFRGIPVNNNDLKKVLAHSLDSQERKEAWEATKEIGAEVEKLALELIQIRNEAARKVGYSNYYTMRLELQELNEQRLFDLLDQLDRLTSPLWKNYKSELDTSLAQKFGISEDQLMPWHYKDPFFQEAPEGALDLDQFYQGKDLVEISRNFYDTLGMPVEDIIARSDLYEREKKNQHAFCTSIDQKQDVRILCNIRDNEYWMGTQLHELGHAVYDKYIDMNLPYTLREPAHTLTTEAVAMLFGRLSRNVEFMEKYCGMEPAIAQQIGLECRKQTAANLLVFARWVLVMTHFERGMYQNPDLDLREFWWDCVERFQWVKRPPQRQLPDWAAKMHLACAPVYYQNYILGEMFASQLLHDMQKNLDAHFERFVSSAYVGDYLKNRLFKIGARYPWEEAIQKTTGERLNPAYFAHDIDVR